MDIGVTSRYHRPSFSPAFNISVDGAECNTNISGDFQLPLDSLVARDCSSTLTASHICGRIRSPHSVRNHHKLPTSVQSTWQSTGDGDQNRVPRRVLVLNVLCTFYIALFLLSVIGSMLTSIASRLIFYIPSSAAVTQINSQRRFETQAGWLPYI
ncbi:hypothetical protein IW261DRAFT_718191 [Armillaria novae-zelandiae]|uniref:Uncharacterized protein n=1 Tax=Armillaria novae-zelandiae TaxID=153914 RepID=A0AA39NWM8_9AGAR|nr:hypothetical protein IW261DRAFT_718191 [Armillaria novae-zelandiae]